MLFEDATRDPAGFVADLQSWLGVTPLPWQVLATPRINETDDDMSGLDPALARRLRAEIRPEVEAFGQLSGLDLGAWATD